MHKAKVHALKHKLGNEEGLLSRVTGESYGNARILDERRAQLAKYKNNAVIDGDMPDKPLPKAPKVTEKVALPRTGEWKPRGFGKKITPKVIRGFNACAVK